MLKLAQVREVDTDVAYANDGYSRNSEWQETPDAEQDRENTGRVASRTGIGPRTHT